MNRPDMLERGLSYYKKVGCPYPILIGDSSKGDYLDKNKALLAKFKGSLDIHHFEYAGLDIVRTHQEMAKEIKTKYSACVADGAFLVVPTLSKCVSFLEENPDYALAHGISTTFVLGNDGAYGSFAWDVGLNTLPILEQDKPSERLQAHVNDYRVAMYCVMRKEHWAAIWEGMHEIENPQLSGEILPTAHAIMLGKVKELKALYLVRHIHSKRNPSTKSASWMTSPNWSKIEERVVNRLSDNLVELEGLPEENARSFAQEAFKTFVNRQIALSKVPKVVRPVSGVRQWLFPLKRYVFSFLPGNELSLPALKRSSSPYHEDFIPVYRTVTREGN